MQALCLFCYSVRRNKHINIYIKNSLELYTSDCVEFFIADGKVIASWSELSEKALSLNKS